MDNADRAKLACGTCGKWNDAGRRSFAEQSLNHPIYGTDFSKQISEIVEDQRKEISIIRGRLGDISSAFPGWKDQLDSVEGLLTCGLVAMADIVKEMKEWEKQWNIQPAKPKPAPVKETKL